MSEEYESEFGRGFTYCIGLFLAHQFMHSEDLGKPSNSYFSNEWMWFNGASDHLYELEIPDNFVLKAECKKWADKVLDLGHGKDLLSAKQEDIDWALEQARKFLLAWDKQCGINTEKGHWE